MEDYRATGESGQKLLIVFLCPFFSSLYYLLFCFWFAWHTTVFNYHRTIAFNNALLGFIIISRLLKSTHWLKLNRDWIVKRKIGPNVCTRTWMLLMLTVCQICAHGGGVESGDTKWQLVVVAAQTTELKVARQAATQKWLLRAHRCREQKKTRRR